MVALSWRMRLSVVTVGAGRRCAWPSSCPSGPPRSRARSCPGPTAPAGRAPTSGGDHAPGSGTVTPRSTPAPEIRAQQKTPPPSSVSSAANEPLTSPLPLLGLLGICPYLEPMAITTIPIRRRGNAPALSTHGQCCVPMLCESERGIEALVDADEKQGSHCPWP